MTAEPEKTFTSAEIAEVAAGIRRLLAAIDDGSLAADARTITRYEGAVAALEALIEGRPFT
jgi:hypothetical protein